MLRLINDIIVLMQDLALAAAREGIVLLQNKNKALPMDKKMKVALIGPSANATNTMKGNYNVKMKYFFLQ